MGVAEGLDRWEGSKVMEVEVGVGEKSGLESA